MRYFDRVGLEHNVVTCVYAAATVTVTIRRETSVSARLLAAVWNVAGCCPDIIERSSPGA